MSVKTVKPYRVYSSFWKEMEFFLFYAWNAIFISFMVLGFAPRLLLELFYNVRTGLIPLSFLVNGIVLTLIPIAATLLAVTRMRNDPDRQFALAYGVEWPLMLLLILRFFVIRQAAPGFTALMVIALLGMGFLLWTLLDPDFEKRGRWVALLKLAGLTIMVLLSLYAAAWLAFYAVPALAGVAQWFWDNLTHPLKFWRGVGDFIRSLDDGGWMWIPFSLFGTALALFTATLVVLAPIVVPIIVTRSWARALRANLRLNGQALSAGAALLVTAVTVISFLVFNRQPQRQAFALLEQPPATAEQARILLDRQEEIRTGLLNAYLAPFRYISSEGEVMHISDMYDYSVGLDRESARKVQTAYEKLARPLLYEPVHTEESDVWQARFALQEEPAQAAELYQRFFDTPIVEGEREEVVRAVRANWSADQVEAAWQAVDDREVHLNRQEITVQEMDGWAEIEIYEVYENRTQSLQEVIYYFNLPESAVLTGVWLGNTPDRDQRFAFQVAPRGAAQAVYREQTRQMKDPALLEQIGPRQYRLRVYPVPPITVTYDESGIRRIMNTVAPMYLWFTYRALPVDGAWPLPHLAFKNNLFWDGSTERTLNGQPVEVADELWMPEAVPLSEAAAPTAHRVDFPNGQSVVVRPAGENAPDPLASLQSSAAAAPQGLRLALVLDRSKSMEALSAEVSAALAQVRDLEARLVEAAPGSSVDVYLTSSPYRGEEPEVLPLREMAGEPVYYGGQNPGELLMQFAELRGERVYDGVLVLTDDSAYELGERKVELAPPGAPVWMVHLGQQVPLGYDDATLEALQASGGGAAGSLDEALARLAVVLSAAGEADRLDDVVDGYLWSVLPTDQAAALAPDAAVHSGPDGFVALLARRLALAEMHRARGAIQDVAVLDGLHELAKTYGIVTPYSSMIVLVDEFQQNLLDHLEENSDRFDREYEGLTNTVPGAPAPLVGVPEPGETLLLILLAGMVGWYAYKQKPEWFAWVRINRSLRG